MAPVLLTKRIEFAAAHRYHRPEWDEAKNRAVFGRCYNPPAHGHNYLLDVTVSGEVDPKTGMVINLFDLKRVLLSVLEEFDHKNLNLDMPYFADGSRPPRTWPWCSGPSSPSRKISESFSDLAVRRRGSLLGCSEEWRGLDSATVTQQRYSFATVQEGNQGREWNCFIAVQGTIDP